MGYNTTRAKEWLDKCYGISSPLYTTVKKVYAEFKRGHTSPNDAESSGVQLRQLLMKISPKFI